MARRSRADARSAALSPGPPTGWEELTDAQWERVRALLPPQCPPTGRPRHDHRTVLAGILWVLRTASPWREMPVRFGKWDTAYARYRLWRRQGLWQQITDALGPEASPPAATVV
jgi:transposase